MARERSMTEFVAMVGRMIRAAARRAGNGDEYELAELLDIQNVLNEGIQEAVDLQRAQNKSWADIATATGTSRQAAQMRWGRKAAS